MIYEHYFNKLINICQLIIQNDLDDAKEKIESLILSHLDGNVKNEELLGHIFATSILKRIDNKLLDTKNIYLQKYDLQQIDLFYKMSKAYPQVACSHSIANQYIKSKLLYLEEASLFDIGIGKGKQLENLLFDINAGHSLLKKINIIGLDPDPANIKDCIANFDLLNQNLGFEVNFYPICGLFEDLKSEDFKLIERFNNNLFINASYSMHHTAECDSIEEGRQQLFDRLSVFKPVLFTLIEPNSDHNENNLIKRLTNSWKHYGTVYKLLDESNIDKEPLFIIKEKFFGREIRDILGTIDFLRSERHEASETWMLRLFKSNFRPYAFHDLVVNLPDYCYYKISDGFVELGYKEFSLIGVFSYEAL